MEIIDKKSPNGVRTEVENRRVVASPGEVAAGKLNMLVKNLPIFREEKPKKGFLRLRIQKRPRQNSF